MGSRKLILLSLLALPLSLGAETASDYINRGAQKYIFGHEEAAKAEVDAGLAKFPNDPELREMLALFKKKPPQDQNNENKSKQDQDKDKKNDQDQNQDKDKPSPTPTPNEDNNRAAPTKLQRPLQVPRLRKANRPAHHPRREICLRQLRRPTTTKTAATAITMAKNQAQIRRAHRTSLSPER